MQRLWIAMTAVVVGLACVAGCGPSLSEKELGNIEYRVPQIPVKPADKGAPEATKPKAEPGAKQPSAGEAAHPPK